MAAGNTYVAIAEQTLSSAAASVTFSSISGAYTDLVLIVSGRSARAAADDSLYIRFNSDTASNYSYTELKGNGSTATSASASSQTFLRPAANIDAASQPAGTFTPVIISINNYSNTTTYKTALARNNMVAAEVTAVVGLWRSTAAISTILVYAASANLTAGSTFSLYGIAAA
jgi:hypothetical protein